MTSLYLVLTGLSDVEPSLGSGVLCLANTKKPELYIKTGKSVFQANAYILMVS
jgi:hypothetical protein